METGDRLLPFSSNPECLHTGASEHSVLFSHLCGLDLNSFCSSYLDLQLSNSERMAPCDMNVHAHSAVRPQIQHHVEEP